MLRDKVEHRIDWKSKQM